MTEREGWVVRFRRPLVEERDIEAGVVRILPTSKGSTGLRVVKAVWRPHKPPFDWDHGKMCYWNGKLWTVKYKKAWKYTTEERAERAAFRLSFKEPSLIGELLVEAWVPLAKPKSR